MTLPSHSYRRPPLGGEPLSAHVHDSLAILRDQPRKLKVASRPSALKELTRCGGATSERADSSERRNTRRLADDPMGGRDAGLTGSGPRSVTDFGREPAAPHLGGMLGLGNRKTGLCDAHCASNGRGMG
jgi:hypothetical protein